jgi:hypothetical protein
MSRAEAQVFLVKRKILPHHTFLAFARSPEEIRDSHRRRHEAPPPPDGKINLVLGKSNRELLQAVRGKGAEDCEIFLLPIAPSDVDVKMLNDDWGIASLEMDGKGTESALLNIA